MCNTLPVNPRDAAHRLAALINRKFNANTDADAVEDAIRNHWGSFSGLAHVIHDECVRQERDYQRGRGIFA